MRMKAYQGSHLPVLMKVVQMTDGPILELGSGMFSSCYLHWACYPTKRRLVTYESSPDYYRFAQMFVADFHEVICVPDWGSADFSEPWGVAFIDHDPPESRGRDIRKLLHAAYVVAHDGGRGMRSIRCGLGGVRSLFRYQFHWYGARPATSVFSNKHSLRRFKV